VIAGAWLSGITAIIFMYFIIGTSFRPPHEPGSETMSPPPISPSDFLPPDHKADLELVDEHMFNDGSGYSKITGTVMNNGDHTFSYVEAKFNIYDAEGNQIDSTSAGIGNLEPHHSWAFKAISFKAGETFKFKGFEAF